MDETTKPKPFCFVLMPFDDSFSDIYALGIKEACKESGAYSERVDEQIYDGGILARIYNQISKADVIIADMTGRNPNVFYEVGYAHAIGKRTILLTQKSEDIPFDLKHFPHIVYNNKIVALKEDLTKRIKWYLENPETKIEEQLAIEVFESDTNLSTGRREITISEKYDQVDLRLIFFNNSSITLSSGNFKVGLIGSDRLKNSYDYKLRERNEIVQLPDKSNMLIVPYFDTLFPSAYDSFEVKLYYDNPSGAEQVVVRLFSNFGTRDYFIYLNFISKA